MILVNFQRFLFIPIALFVCILSLQSCGNSQEKVQPADTQKAPAEKQNLNVEQLNGMILKDPNNSQLYYERALAYCEAEDFGAAIKDFDKTLELEPDFASAYHDRGICRYQLQMLNEALTDFNKAIELDPNYYEAYFNRALVYDEKGKAKEALEDLNTSIKINPEFGDAYYNRGVYLLNTDRKKACADFEKASKLGIEEATITMEQYCK